MSGQESVLLALAGDSGAADCADLAQESGKINLRSRPSAMPQSRSLEGGVEIARIGQEGLPLGFEERDEPVPRDTEQRTQQPAVRKLADRRHPGEAVRTAVRPAANQVRLDLIIPMVTGEQVHTAVGAAPVA